MLILLSRCEAPVKSVVAPALLSSVRHHQQFCGDQPPSETDSVGGCAGDLPDGSFLRHVAADFDDIARLQGIRRNAPSRELKSRRAFDGPSLACAGRTGLFQEDKAMRINPLKLDDRPLPPHR